MTVLCFWQFWWSLSWHLLTAIYPCPVVNFHISGTKWASPGTQDIMGRFRDDPGHSGTVGKPNIVIPIRSNRFAKQPALMSISSDGIIGRTAVGIGYRREWMQFPSSAASLADHSCWLYLVQQNDPTGSYCNDWYIVGLATACANGNICIHSTLFTTRRKCHFLGGIGYFSV